MQASLRMPTARCVLVPMVAAFATQMLACEMDVPPIVDPSTYESASTTSSTETISTAPRGHRAPLLPSAGGAGTAQGRTPAPAPRSSRGVGADDPFADRPALRAFVAGGETRFLCPSRYRPVPAEGGCACVSSIDGLTEYPMGDAPCGDGAARAEGNECIFTCPTRRE